MMDHIPDRSLEGELARLFREEREGWDWEAGRARRVEACVAACQAEAAARGRGEASASLPAFLTAQARFTPPGAWVAIAAVGVLAVAGAWAGADGPAAFQALSCAGGLLALVCLVGVTRSKTFGMGELESSCPFNAVSVSFARLLIFGAPSALVLALGLASAGTQGLGASRALALMAAPYLTACAGGLMCARRAAGPDAMGAAVAWASSVTAASALLFYAAPAAYAAASAWAWYLACLASGSWCASEVRAWLGEGARGFAPLRGDGRSPLNI